MKIKKVVNEYLVFYYYRDSKTSNIIDHGLFNNYLACGIGYFYHGQSNGFWLKNNNWL